MRRLYDAAMRAAQIRKSRGLSQAELALLVGVEQPTISRFEKGSGAITLRLIKQVAAALDVTVSDLFQDDRNEAEQTLIDAFRQLPRDRQLGWLDLAQTLQASLLSPAA